MTSKPTERRGVVKPTKVGECCEILKLALERQPSVRFGLFIETAMDFKTGDTRDALVIRFRKASKGDAGTYGHGKQYADATFAEVRYCPFCGTKARLP